jgi:regulator of replication initiation timing
MKQVEFERVGRALRQMAEDLVTERRRVVLLQRENRQLKTELEELRRVVAAQDVDTSVGDLGRHPGVPD